MSDLIERQAAIGALIRKRQPVNNGDGTITITMLADEVIRDVLNELPSVQPEIIRCKDCKYWMRAYLSISGKHGCNVMRDYTAPDDYCFKAERKA